MADKPKHEPDYHKGDRSLIVKLLVQHYHDHTSTAITQILDLTKAKSETVQDQQGNAKVTLRQLNDAVQEIVLNHRQPSTCLEASLRFAIQNRRLVTRHFLILEQYNCSASTDRHIHFTDQLTSIHMALYPEMSPYVKFSGYKNQRADMDWSTAFQELMYDTAQYDKTEGRVHSETQKQVRHRIMNDTEFTVINYYAKIEDCVSINALRWYQVVIETQSQISVAWQTRIASSLARWHASHLRQVTDLTGGSLLSIVRGSKMCQTLLASHHYFQSAGKLFTFNGFLEGSAFVSSMDAIRRLATDDYSEGVQFEGINNIKQFFVKYLEWTNNKCLPWQDISKCQHEDTKTLTLIFQECLVVTPSIKPKKSKHAAKRERALFLRLPLIQLLHQYLQTPHDTREGSDVECRLVVECQIVLQSLKAYIRWNGQAFTAEDFLMHIRRSADHLLANPICAKFIQQHDTQETIRRLQSPPLTQRKPRLIHFIPALAGEIMLNEYSEYVSVGLQLLDASSVLGAVMHMYRLARDKGSLRLTSPVLESITPLFGPQIFGTDTKTDHITSWMTYQGIAKDRNESWSLEQTPTFKSQRPLNTQLSIFWQCIEGDLETDADFRARLSSVLPERHSSRKACRHLNEALPCEYICTAIGTTPKAAQIGRDLVAERVDLFKVFEVCCIVLTQLGKRAVALPVKDRKALHEQGWLIGDDDLVRLGVEYFHVCLVQNHRSSGSLRHIRLSLSEGLQSCDGCFNLTLG